MTPTLPSIGDRESAQLEFKSIRIVVDAGRALSTIGREVVAMLNTTGGRIWIGVEEENEVAVKISGTTLTKINDLRSRLANYIVDSIEPRALDEVSMQAVPAADGTHLLCCDVGNGKNTPYCLRQGAAMLFVRRFEARVVPMQREELFAMVKAATSIHDDHRARMIERRNHIDRERSPTRDPWLWMRSATHTRDATAFGRRYFEGAGRADLSRLLDEPERLGNRLHGWIIRREMNETIETSQGRRSLTSRHRQVSFFENGSIELRVDAPLFLLDQGWHPVDPNELNPWALAEWTVSFMRLARELYLGLAEVPETVLVDFCLFRATGTWLRPQSPGRAGHIKPGRARNFDDESFRLPRPYEFSMRELADGPDACARRLLLPLYESFGFDETGLPPEFDRATGRFRIQA